MRVNRLSKIALIGALFFTLNIQAHAKENHRLPGDFYGDLGTMTQYGPVIIWDRNEMGSKNLFLFQDRHWTPMLEFTNESADYSITNLIPAGDKLYFLGLISEQRNLFELDLKTHHLNTFDLHAMYDSHDYFRTAKKVNDQLVFVGAGKGMLFDLKTHTIKMLTNPIPNDTLEFLNELNGKLFFHSAGDDNKIQRLLLWNGSNLVDVTGPGRQATVSTQFDPFSLLSISNVVEYRNQYCFGVILKTEKSVVQATSYLRCFHDSHYQDFMIPDTLGDPHLPARILTVFNNQIFFVSRSGVAYKFDGSQITLITSPLVAKVHAYPLVSNGHMYFLQDNRVTRPPETFWFPRFDELLEWLPTGELKSITKDVYIDSPLDEYLGNTQRIFMDVETYQKMKIFSSDQGLCFMTYSDGTNCYDGTKLSPGLATYNHDVWFMGQIGKTEQTEYWYEFTHARTTTLVTRSHDGVETVYPFP